MEQNKKSQPGLPDNDSREFSDDITKSKIDRHLHDIKDEISEEDIKNISTDISSTATARREEEIKKQPAPAENKDKKKDEDEPKNEMPTSWDIMQ